MSSTNPMTREELIENAALDAFGFLDEYEAALYTRSFYHAPTAFQEEIIRMQADMVSDETPLPNVIPDETLRDRVLDAVAGAIERENAQLEPLASIGRPRHKDDDVVGTIHNGSAARLWRAAAFILSATVIVVSYFGVEANSRNHQIIVGFLYRQNSEELQRVGPSVKNFLFDRSAKWRVLTPKTAGSAMKATLVYNDASKDIVLIIDALPFSNTKDYELFAKDSSGTRTALGKFDSTGFLSGVTIRLDTLASTLSTMVLEVTDRGGNVILTTAA